MKNIKQTLNTKSGFSLVELLVAIAVGSIVITLIVTAFWSQTKTSKTQQLVMDLQQNIRSGMLFMQQDIMMAGFSEETDATDATITTANGALLEFTYRDPLCREDLIDNDNDGDVDEDDERDGIDNDGDNHVDEIGELETVRLTLQGNELHRLLIEESSDDIRVDDVIAHNIDGLEFFYILKNGTAGTTFDCGGTDDCDNIQKIGISILARTEFETPGYTDNQVYTTLSGAQWGPFNDHNQREIMTTTVMCRNMLNKE